MLGVHTVIVGPYFMRIMNNITNVSVHGGGDISWSALGMWQYYVIVWYVMGLYECRHYDALFFTIINEAMILLKPLVPVVNADIST